MPCERCSAQFTVLRRRRPCCECGRHFCGGCVGRGPRLVCPACRVLVSRPLPRHQLEALRARDLQCFLREHRVSTAGCVEKEDLVALVVSHVDRDDFAPRPPPPSELSQTLAQLRGFTANLLHQAFDIGDRPNRPARGNKSKRPGDPAPSTPSTPASPNAPNAPNSPSSPETPAPSAPAAAEAGESPQTPLRSQPPSRSEPEPSPDETEDVPLAETDDCLEIEDDPDDPDWEIISSSLPGDSEILLLEEIPRRAAARAASDLDLPSRSAENASFDASSLKGASIASGGSRARIDLRDLKDLSDVESLKVKQLKELLALNRVDFKGCCERKELLERAKRLWRESAKSKEDLETTESAEELCKICMDAPMECVMLECGHIATCLGCGKRLHECPICREYVVRVVRFFRS